jgi:hypothetical protein
MLRTLLGFLLSAPLLAASTGHTPAGQAPADIHAFDFRNFTYLPSCADFAAANEPQVALKTVDGKFEGAAGSDLKGFLFEVRDVAYGDLTGDGKDEAVVRTLCNTGGSGSFDEEMVFTMKDGQPILLGRVPGGDRAVGAVRCARVEGGALKAERVGNDTGAAVGIEFVDTETWRLQGGRFVRAGDPVHRPLQGAKVQPIHFEKGATSAVVHGKTAGSEEYVLRASGGQTLAVSIASTAGKEKSAAFEVMLDDLTLTCRTTEWSGKLPATGEYRIYVVATHGTADYALNVSIR